MEITNTDSNGEFTQGGIVASASSPKLFKRLFADVEKKEWDQGDGNDGSEDQRTPKKAKLAKPEFDDGIISEEEVQAECWRGLPSVS
jgi:hypothetical protein